MRKWKSLIKLMEKHLSSLQRHRLKVTREKKPRSLNLLRLRSRDRRPLPNLPPQQESQQGEASCLVVYPSVLHQYFVLEPILYLKNSLGKMQCHIMFDASNRNRI
jgi:hypothetical protein